MSYRNRSPAAGYPEQWSLIEIQTINGAVLSMNLPVSPTIQDYFLAKMKETGFLPLRNGAESLAVRADMVVAFKLTQLTTGEPK
jgi:hypothetical protein